MSSISQYVFCEIILSLLFYHTYTNILPQKGKILFLFISSSYESLKDSIEGVVA